MEELSDVDLTAKDELNDVIDDSRDTLLKDLHALENRFPGIHMIDPLDKSIPSHVPIHLKEDFLGPMLFPHLGTKKQRFPRLRSLSQIRKNTSTDLIKDLFCPAHTVQNIKLFGGQKAMEMERERSKNSGFVIHPCSKFRQYWDLVILSMLVFNMFILPLDVSFFSDNTFVGFHIASDLLCMVDIILNFRTGFRQGYDINEFQLDGKEIAKHYFKTWFAIDVLSTLPLHYIFMLMVGEQNGVSLGLKGASRAFKFLKVAKLLNLLKLLRFSRIVRGISQYEEVYCFTAGIVRYIKLVAMMLIVAHWNGCVHFLVPMLQDFPEQCWVRLCKLEKSPWYTQYGWALFKTLSHMLCIGYGRFIPQLLSEALITIFSMITGATFYALFIAHSMAYMIQNDASKNSYQETYKQIEEYMIFRNLPTDLQKRVSNYFEQKYHQGRFFDEEKVLSEISPPLRDEIINHTCRDLVRNVSFFKAGCPEFISAVLHKLSFDVYLSGDTIVKEGFIGAEMFFIRKGCVEVLVDGVFIENLKSGAYFGEISLLTNARRVITVVAATNCDVFLLRATDFQDILLEYPDMKPIIEHAAIQRVEDICRKTGLISNNNPHHTGTNNDTSIRHRYASSSLSDETEEITSAAVTPSRNSRSFTHLSYKMLQALMHLDDSICHQNSSQGEFRLSEADQGNVKCQLKAVLEKHKRRYVKCSMCRHVARDDEVENDDE